MPRAPSPVASAQVSAGVAELLRDPATDGGDFLGMRRSGVRVPSASPDAQGSNLANRIVGMGAPPRDEKRREEAAEVAATSPHRCRLPGRYGITENTPWARHRRRRRRRSMRRALARLSTGHGNSPVSPPTTRLGQSRGRPSWSELVARIRLGSPGASSERSRRNDVN